MKKLRTSAVWTIIGFSIGLILLLYLFFSARPSSSTQITSTMLRNSIENASDLITTEYNYAEVGKYENAHEINGWTIPFTNKNFLLTYQGQVKLGINARDLKITLRNQKVTVDCPPIEVLSNTIDEESVEIYDESMNVFNPISIQDYLNFAAAQKKAALKKIDENGVVDRAKQETERSLRQLLEMIPDIAENYTIEIRFPEQDRPLYQEDEADTEHSSDDSQDNPETENGEEQTAANLDAENSENDNQE